MESATISSLAEDVSRHLQMIQNQDDGKKAARKHLDEEVKTAPLFSAPAQQVFEQQYQQENDTDNKPDDDGNTAKDTQPLTHRVYPQYGLLGLRMQSNQSQVDRDNLVYANISAPWSTFICGSQGSGKSHTLSCLLENALIASSPAGQLSSPLAGLVCHYDKFTAYGSTQLCEAAYLCSSGIPVRVLVSPTNYVAMKEAYENLPGLGDASKLLCVVPMYLSQRHLNINVIKTLMGIGSGPNQPLYVEVRLLMTLLDSERGLLAQFIMKILRNMARTNQGRASFDYNAFKQHIENEEFVKGQARPLQMRLDVLESFFEPGTVFTKGQKKPQRESGDIWQFSKGTLTIIDLSCPFVGPDDACALFNICISLFLKDRALAGRMIALDEAHKFLTAESSEAGELTETLLSIIRQQRHLGTRVVIATQEPTVSPALLDLCNVTIVHRFTSPAWFKAIKGHIAGASMDNTDPNSQAVMSANELFRQIVQLKTGQALVFSPTALLDVDWVASKGPHDTSDSSEGEEGGDSGARISPQGVSQLGPGCFHLKVRARVTADGGRSHLAK